MTKIRNYGMLKTEEPADIDDYIFDGEDHLVISDR